MKLSGLCKQVTLTAVLLGTFGLMLSGCKKKADATVPPANPMRGGGGHIDWETDWDKARQTAQSEGKDLLIDFAGSDWCYWCQRLDSEVFTQPAFIEKAKEDFVFVLLDFPNDKSGQSQALQQQNERLSQEFGVQGFPTVFLAHPDGRPYAQTGYFEGGGKAYLEHLNELKKQKNSP